MNESTEEYERQIAVILPVAQDIQRHLEIDPGWLYENNSFISREPIYHLLKNLVAACNGNLRGAAECLLDALSGDEEEEKENC
jgi:hypothetical protein